MVFGVNGGSMKSHLRFSAKHGFPFDLLEDAGSAVALAYDARVLHNHYTKRTVVSAAEGWGLDLLLHAITERLDRGVGVDGNSQVHFID